MILFFSTMDPDSQAKMLGLYESYKRLMFSIALDITRNTTRAEDVVSESVLKISKIISKIEKVDSPRTRALVCVITKNTAIDMLRKEKGRLEAFDESYMGAYTGVDEDLEIKEDYARAMSAINSLSDRYKEVLILRYVSELEDEEIAKVLDITRENVRKRAERGRRKVVDMLKAGEIYG